MSEEVQNIPLSPERLLAAILKKFEVVLTVEELIADYSNHQIAVTQGDDESIYFELVEVDEQEFE